MLSAAGHEVIDSEDGWQRASALSLLSEADAIVVGLNEFPRSLVEAATKALVVAKPGVGVDNIDVEAATGSGILVCNTPGSNAESVADHTIGLALAAFRNIVGLDAQTRNGTGWDQWPYVGAQLSGKCLGVVGTGHVGAAVVRRGVHGFGMSAIAFDLRPDPVLERDYGLIYTNLDDVLRNCDVLTIHTPLLASTRSLIRDQELRLMRPQSILVNTSRGGIVDEAALAAALAEGRLAGAAVDVFETEPAVSSPLFTAPNTVLTPHVAGYSAEASLRSRVMTAENVVAALRGEPLHVVNDSLLSAPNCRLRRLAV